MGRPTTTACMIMLSCEGWVPHVLDGIAPYVDEVVVVQGATPEMVDLGMANEDGSHRDNTEEVLHREAKRLGNVTVLPWRMHPHRNAMRNRYLSQVRTEWMWVVDHDEFYHPQTIRVVQDAMRDQHAVCLATRWWEFYAWTRRFDREPGPMERIVRVVSGMGYPDKNTGQSIIYPDDSMPWPRRRVVGGEADRCYHFNRVLDGCDLAVKLMYYAMRDYKGMRPADLVAQAHEQPSFRKTATGGVYVPIDTQPPAAQGLVDSGVAPATSMISRMDRMNRGTTWESELVACR